MIRPTADNLGALAEHAYQLGCILHREQHGIAIHDETRVVMRTRARALRSLLNDVHSALDLMCADPRAAA